MKGYSADQRRFWWYVCLTIAFWALALGAWHGDGSNGGTAVHLSVKGAGINLLLLIPLWRGAEWARWLLAFEGTVLALGVGWLGFPPFGPLFGALAFVAAAQLALLFSLHLHEPAGRSQLADPAGKS